MIPPQGTFSSQDIQVSSILDDVSEEVEETMNIKTYQAEVSSADILHFTLPAVLFFARRTPYVHRLF